MDVIEVDEQRVVEQADDALSAQSLIGLRIKVDEEVWSFFLTDGERTVEISHEIGDRETAAQRFDELADRARLHAEWLRAQDRGDQHWV